MCGKFPSTSSEPAPASDWKYILLAGVILIYAVFFLQQFLGDPLGQSPVLDARENLAWAEKIASHDLPGEPFYRALLYPWILSWMPNPELLAPVLGVFCHLLNALLCGLIARQLWRSSAAAWLSALSYGAYPVALFFAVQVLDITFALMLFLMAVFCLLRIAKSPSWVFPVLSGLLAGLAVLARPNFLPPALIFALLAWGIVYVQQKNGLRGLYAALLVAAPMLLLFVAQGMINQRLSGEFRVLPWQGSYNLYAANRDNANGKFYKQQVAFDAVPAGMNTTRMESEFLYREALGAKAPQDVDAMGGYWRSQLIETITGDPIRWVSLMGRKVVFLFNDWEQYNNLTYAYHKERFSSLFWNPLGWGLLLLGAIAAIGLNWERLSKPELIGLGLLGLAYAAGLLLFFVSARFRLPLAPLLCIFCGGLAGLSLDFLRAHRKRGMLLLGCLILTGLLSYGNWLGARERKSFIQDEILLANAALRSGDDAAALNFAQAALSRDGSRQEARRIRVSAFFNLWMMHRGTEQGANLWGELGQALEQVGHPDATISFIRGVVNWRRGDKESAIKHWRSGVEQYGAAAGNSARALQVADAGTFVDERDPMLQAISALLSN